MAASKTSSGRFYFWKAGDVTERFWAVTTILELGLPKQKFLTPWAARATAQYAFDNLDILYAMTKKMDREGAIRWLAGKRFDVSEKAKLTGTHVHDAIEAYKLERPYPGVPRVAQPYYAGFLQLLDDQRPIFLATEANVYNRTTKVAGRLDEISVWPNLERYMAERNMDIEQFWPKPWKDERGPVLIGDTKSGKGIYPEVGLQLAPYSRAEFIGGPDGREYPLPEIDGAIALHYQPGWCEILPINIGEDIYRSFQYVYEVARYAEEFAKTVIGPPVAVYEAPPGPEDPDELREQIGALWERLVAAEEQAANPGPVYLEATSGRGKDPERHAVTDPPAPHPSGKRFAALCGGQVGAPGSDIFNPMGRNVCKKCASKTMKTEVAA